MNPVECSAGELFCPQPDTRFLVEYVRRDYAMLTRTARVNRHLKHSIEFSTGHFPGSQVYFLSFSVISDVWSRFSATPHSSLSSQETSIICLFVMRTAKSRSLTSENGYKISLTPEDYQNCCFAVFCRNGNGAVKFFWAQRCSYEG